MARKGKYCRFLEAQEVESTPSDGAVELYPRHRLRVYMPRPGPRAPVLPQKRSATRKRQAKRPCLGTEVVAENEGCTCSFSAHAAMDNIVDENSTDSDSSNDSDSDSSSSGEDMNAQRWVFRLQIGRSMHVLLI